MDSPKLQLAISVILAYNVNFRSAVASEVRQMTNVISYRPEWDVMELSVLARRSFHNEAPELTMVVVPATLVRCRNNKALVYICHEEPEARLDHGI